MTLTKALNLSLKLLHLDNDSLSSVTDLVDYSPARRCLAKENKTWIMCLTHTVFLSLIMITPEILGQGEVM